MRLTKCESFSCWYRNLACKEFDLIYIIQWNVAELILKHEIIIELIKNWLFLEASIDLQALT